MSTSEILTEKLKILKQDNSVSSYSHIRNIMMNQDIPLPSIVIKPSKLIRYRKHNDLNKNYLFESSEELSYNKDILKISDFGRANEPGQGFFYCNDNKNQDTGISEVVSIFRGNHDSEEEILTISAWELNENLMLAVILPSNENIGKNKYFDDSMDKFYEKLGNNTYVEDLKKFLDFIATEYTLDIEKHNSNYKVTSAFSNYIKNKFPEVDGIIYSSVKSEYQGENIVLWPETVDRKINFLKAKKSVFKKARDKAYVEKDIAESKSFDKINDVIYW